MNRAIWSSAAWYSGTREEFLSTQTETIANQLAGRAAQESLEVEASQHDEWLESVSLLQETLGERIPILRTALMAPGCEAINDVILEFDFHRRGLRMDCLLLASGALFVIEFKRTRLQRADRDQVMTYAVNLLEFHRVTRDWCSQDGAIVCPILALTRGAMSKHTAWPGLAGHSWPALANRPLECDANGLGVALGIYLNHRRCEVPVSRSEWLSSPFSPSSSILDAALSLYGNHDVSAISEHAAPKAAIASSVDEVRSHIEAALAEELYHVIFLSGAPGAGKTLVGLEVVMRGAHAGESVFVTGNAPLVDVLNKALVSSYRAQGRQASSWTPTGYRSTDAKMVASAASYKVVKAHNFLGKRGKKHGQHDGRVLVFDEAQRTYEKGRVVLGEKLEDHEADLILSVQREAFPQGGAVVVALIGHNQAINRGERGMVAWLEAADRYGWSFSISDETLAQAALSEWKKWETHPRRKPMRHGHLQQSMRYYRNSVMEEWAGAVLNGSAVAARALVVQMEEKGNSIWLTRDLAAAKRWARRNAVAGQRSGMIASGQARRLAAEGLFVDYKPDIATWMLAPSTDIRSSNALETVQNQYQIQGLELDYCIVCWDADLRRDSADWLAFKLSGEDWQRDKLVDVAKNGYRVLLTRARKGMVIFVPTGDLAGEDETRRVEFYDEVAKFLGDCGVKQLVE